MGYGHENLTKDEIVNLCRSIKEGCHSEKGSDLYQCFIVARNRLVEANLALVTSWLKRHHQSGRHETQDMIQEGCLGVIEAAKRFDLSFGTEFSTYAVFWIRQSILKFVKEDNCFSVKQSAWNAKGLVDRARKRLMEAGKPTDPESVRKEAGMSVARFKSASKCYQNTVLDTDRPLPHEMTSSDESDYDDRDMTSYRRVAVRSALDRIDTRQAYVLRHRFGIDCERETQKEIGREIKVGNDTVMWIERDGLDAMTQTIGAIERCD
jgi:RNA polymerase primary sigma factor